MNASSLAAARPVGLALWLLGARPRTLPLSVAPVLAAWALAWMETGVFKWSVAVATLIAAVLIQIGTNLHNDAADGESGLDGPDRVGPPRITASGWASVKAVKGAAWATFATAAMIGLYIAWVGGWPIMVVGALSLIAGWAYTSGPFPIAYTPLGELFVFLFFGMAAVCGAYWLQADAVSPACAALGAIMGAPAAAVLLVNNHRDRVSDARAGRRTLAIVMGERATLVLYTGLLLAPLALLPALAALSGAVGLLGGLIAAPLAVILPRGFRATPPGPGFNRLLGRTAVFQAVLALGSSLGGLLF